MRRALLVLALALGAGTAEAAVPITLAPHRAVYDLSLAHAGSGGTVAASGEMTFEVHDACSAWATEQTLTINSIDREGHESSTRSDYATFESKDGHTFNFTMRQIDGGRTASDLRGRASILPGQPGEVQFTEPAGTELTLPTGTLFPMTHTRTILQAAAAGAHALAPILFDGTGTDGAEYTYATILGWAPAQDPPIVSLSGMQEGRIHIAFYPLNDRGMTPEYELGSRFFANGVSDRLDMDFGDFRLKGHLRSLVLLPVAAPCRGH